LKDRLLAKCERATSGCLEWQGYLNPKGYGKIARGGNVADFGMTYVHIAAYELFIGPVPAGMEVCHSCDNRPCCEPTHLFLGTHKQNMEDMVAKSRQARGERSAASKLKPSDIVEIRERARRFEQQKTIAASFGLHPSHVSRIVGGKKWRHLPADLPLLSAERDGRW
jgi:hypothetical protein